MSYFHRQMMMNAQRSFQQLWTPAEMPTALWLDAADANTVIRNGSNQVSAWNDKSGNNYHATTASLPSYLPNSKLIRVVYPKIGFSTQCPYTSSMSVFAVAAANAVAPNNPEGVFISNIFTPTADVFGGGVFLQTHNVFINTTQHSYGTETRAPAHTNASSLVNGVSGRLVTSRYQLAVFTYKADGLTHFASTKVSIGARDYYGYIQADLAEVIVLHQNVSLDTRYKFEGFLAHKWGLAANLPSGHPYKSAPPRKPHVVGPKFDMHAADYIKRVEEADGQSLERGVQLAINDFVVGCKSDGIWTAIKASCILAGARTLNGALRPLVGPAPTNYNFVSGDYNRKTGLKGNGSSKYLDTNRLISADPVLNSHIASYVSESTGVTIGRILSGPTGSVVLSAVNPIGGRLRNDTYTASSLAFSAPGFLAFQRTQSTGFTARAMSSEQFLSATAVDGVTGNYSVFLFPATYSIARIPFYSIGSALDLSKLDARVSDLMDALNGAIA